MAPRLSVVVPIYNVELYLEECLASLAAQTFDDFEVVMVDDGSTDSSAEIAEAFAQRDPRFRLVQQENKGLGPARNTGSAAVDPDAEFLTFVDSDDIVPPKAYQLMIETLEQTGSDFVAGNVHRFRAVGSSPSWVHRAPFGATRLRTHISKHPSLVTDRTAWNKVYRRSFWDRHAMQYPGILYEDAPVSVPLHYLATSVDCLAEPVYLWRMREVGSRSITQNSTDPKGLIDRVTSISMVRDFLKTQAQADPEFHTYLQSYDLNVLVEELEMFFRSLAKADDVYRTAFLDHVGRIVEDIEPTLLTELPEGLRIKYWLTAKRRMDDLLAVLAFEEVYPRAIPTRGTLRPKADYPVLKDSPPLDEAVATLVAAVGLHATVDAITWENGRLKLEGHAFQKNLGAEHRYDSVRALILRRKKSQRTLVLPTRTVRRPDVTAENPNLPFHHADWSGWSVTVDPERLKKRGEWQDASWAVTLAQFGAGRPRRTRIKEGQTGSGQSPAPFWVSEDVRLIPEITDQHLGLRVETVKARVTSAEPVGDLIELGGSLRAQPGIEDGVVLVLRHTEDGSSRVVDYVLELGAATGDQVSFTVRIDPADLERVQLEHSRNRPSTQGRDKEHWSADLVHADGHVVPVVLDLGADSPSSVQFPLVKAGAEVKPGDRALLFKASPRGYLQICDQRVQPVVESVTVLPDQSAFQLQGSYPVTGTHTFDLVLRHKRHTRRPQTHPAQSVDGTFTALLPAYPNDVHSGELPLRAGEWELLGRLDTEATDGPDAGEIKLHLAPRAHTTVPLQVTARGKTVTLARRWYDCLLLTAADSLTGDEAGSYHQRRLREETYPAARTQPLRPTVLYTSYNGGPYADSPRALHQELLTRGTPLQHLWVVDDLQADIPPTATPIRLHSPQWYQALATSRYIITNTELPPWVHRRPGQTILQTWHGTPVKRIGFDFDNDWYADPDQLHDLEHGAAQWNLLLSPNPPSTPVLRRALRYTGTVLETGLPRTDQLHAPDRDKRAQAVREQLGLPPGKTVVLYAPTWREDQLGFDNILRLNLQLDLAAAKAALSQDQVLLVRPHPRVGQIAPGAGDGYLWDVADYPDAQDLLLAADILVTDYSALLPDWVGTGKPVLLFDYDLEHYRDNLRGFSFDYQNQAPGPILRTSTELIHALQDIHAATQPHQEAYTAYQQAYSPWDDGKATTRVIDALLEDQG
ncbi:CDP-glycerol glycerophosphotransferase family protein [Streptacidiphilus sp. N1-10]|uniref:CDP-glycerol glycerophosphotransferase family protein n=1 Tax=Streptacidiphilus jeojiensis TaxID=3229225 RepID=A0ABV6XF91_9ACTN